VTEKSGGVQQRTQSVLLKKLDQSELADVLAQCERVRYHRHQQVVRQHGIDDHIYLVESGRLGVAQYAESGREVGYCELYPGDHFGELTAIDGRPRSANVIALVDSEVTVMPFEVFRSLVDSSRTFSVALMRHLTDMVRRLSDRVYEFSTLSVSNRIHAELLRLAIKHKDLDSVARIATPPTHAQLASRISCNREAVSREMKRLENTGLLKKSGKKWIVEDLTALQRMVDEVHVL
jgi:CRP-like cAMP-binding protein